MFLLSEHAGHAPAFYKKILIFSKFTKKLLLQKENYLVQLRA